MIKTEPGWELYRTFLDVMRDGSLSGAARRLGLTQPTAGRHIDALEQALGIKLFTRSQRGLTATSAAMELLPHVEAMEAANNALLRTASAEAGEVRGTVRITASEITGCELLPPMLSDFCSSHRGIAIELALNNRAQDLLRRDADIAVRMFKPKQEALIARRIGFIQIGLFAHRTYIRDFGTPRSVRDLAHHRLIGFDKDDISLRSVGGASRDLQRSDFGFRCDSDVAQLAAIRAGIGIGGCQVSLATRDENLVPILPKEIAFKLEMWLVMHEDQKATRRVRLVFDHLAQKLAAFVAAQGV